MFNALTGKRFNDMIGLLEMGHSVAEVAAWLDVKEEYVQEHAAVIPAMAELPEVPVIDEPQEVPALPEPFTGAVLPVEPVVKPKPALKKKTRSKK